MVARKEAAVQELRRARSIKPADKIEGDGGDVEVVARQWVDVDPQAVLAGPIRKVDGFAEGFA